MLSLEVNEIAIGYEALIEAMLDFVIIGFTILLVEKFMNSFRRKAQDPKDKTV
jgi:large conductance mechanosensitive channel